VAQTEAAPGPGLGPGFLTLVRTGTWRRLACLCTGPRMRHTARICTVPQQYQRKHRHCYCHNSGGVKLW